MAEPEKIVEPLSLNQRHNRLLQDLSVSHSKPKPPPEAKVKLEGRRRLCKAASIDDDYIPQFSGITDFDSPSPAEMKSSKVPLEGFNHFGRDDDCENRPDNNRLNFSDCQVPVAEKPSNVKNEGGVLPRGHIASENIASLDKFTNSGVNAFSSQPEEDKPLKHKIEGRRRLCKVSSKDEHDGEGKSSTEHNEPNFNAIADFDSPSPVKNVTRSTHDGGREIRDILNELSSKFDILSIEKPRIPKTRDLIGGSSDVVINEGNNCLKKKELSESIAGSLSLLASNKGDSSLGATKNVANQFVNDLQKESEDDKSVCVVDKFKAFGERQKKSEVKRVGGNITSTGKLFRSTSSVQELDDDDCVVTSGKDFCEVERRQRKVTQKSDFDDVDVLDDYRDVSGDENSFILSDPKSSYKLPGKIAKMLYPHQRDGLKWLWSLHCQGKGGILGDDMGLGKTMQICGFVAGLFNSRLTKRILVVAPKTLLPHWIKELSIVGLSEKTREYSGTCVKAREYELKDILQHGGILLTTYDIVRNNVKSLRGDHYFFDDRSEDDIIWDYMILDEGHLIKNPSTQRAKSLLEIPSSHRIIISGTPIQNNLKELWALFNFCCPELLGDKKWFKDKYESAILRGNNKNASDRDKRIGSAVAKELRTRIQPYFLRRLKNEVFREDDPANAAKLSKKNEIIVWLRLSSCQRQLYEAFLKSELVLSAFDGSPLAALTILKKICDHPLLLTKRAAEDVLEGMDSMLNQEDQGMAEKLAMHLADVTEKIDFVEKHEVSCKISFILSLLRNLIPKGHNVLIFSQTRKMLNLIQECLASEGYEFLRIDGTTKATDRLKIVNNFQEGNGAPIFLLTSQVGGLGLTLTKADRVIVVDPAWNPSTDNQSVDRAYRIGQEKDVVVYRLMTCGTVEEKIYRKQIYKGGLFKSATEHKEQIRYFSQQDLRELFSIPKQGFDISLTQQQLHEEHDRQHTMEDSLKSHIQFLETLGIAGVSNHSLLFSKTAPVPVVPEYEIARVKQSTFVGTSYSSSSIERNVNGSEFAFNPKDVKLNKKNSPPNSGSKLAESEIKRRIERLSLLYANKAMISNLPDKGEKIQKQIAELNSELDMIQMEKGKEKETIDLDDLTGHLQRVLNV